MENSIFHFDFNKFLIWLNLFNIIKGDDDNNSVSDNLLWICILLVGIVVLTMLIIRCWLCCDPNCEGTKEKMKELKKKLKKFFSRCFSCCESDDDIIEPIRSNTEPLIIMDTQEVDQRLINNNRMKIYNNINNNNTSNIDNNINNNPISRPQVLDPSINFMNEINIPCYDSNQLVDKSKIIDNSDKEILVYYPTSTSRNTPSHISNNIVQPSIPLPFIPVDTKFPNFMILDGPDIIFEKYIYNADVKSIHKIYYSTLNPEGETSPLCEASSFSFAMVKMEFISLIKHISFLDFSVYKYMPVSPPNPQFEILAKEQFFDPGKFDVLVMMARIKIDNDTFMEIYDIENLIRIINELYVNFINEWDKVFSQYHWNLIKDINNRFLRLKNSENGVEFNYIKVLRRTKYMYIDNIILEDKVLRKNSIMHTAIKDYNYLKFNIGSIMEKVDTSLIKLNEVEDES
jgi:hypothetical protein